MSRMCTICYRAIHVGMAGDSSCLGCSGRHIDLFLLLICDIDRLHWTILYDEEKLRLA